MRTQNIVIQATLLIVVPLALDIAGCASTSDLAKVQRDVDLALHETAQIRSLRGRIDELQTTTKEKSTTANEVEGKIRALETKIDVLSDEVIRELGVMKKTVAEVTTKRPEDLQTLQTQLGDLKRQIGTVRQEQSAGSAKIERLHVLTASLLRTYKVQQENLRGYLREAEQVAKELNASLESSQKGP
jgi:chromosome segregation ATPase